MAKKADSADPGNNEGAREQHVNLVAASSRFEGIVEFGDYTRFEGQITGTLRGNPGSQLVLGEQAVVEGEIEGDTVIVDGFVRGNIVATTRVVISETGRVIGEIKAPIVGVKFGGFFDGSCSMRESAAKQTQGL